MTDGPTIPTPKSAVHISDLLLSEDEKEIAARALHDEMQRLDASDMPSWDQISEGDRYWFRSCIEAIWVALRASTNVSRR